MTLRDLYLVANIELKIVVTNTDDVLFQGEIGKLRYSQMGYEIEEIRQWTAGTLHIVVKEK